MKAKQAKNEKNTPKKPADNSQIIIFTDGCKVK
jgi:hypothetical protein